MKYILRARLEPAAVFGLPDGDKIVIPIAPGGETTFASPPIDRITGKLAGYGTLSEFRKPVAAIDWTATIGTTAIRARDNFIALEIEADNPQAGLDAAMELLDRLCQCLSVRLGQRAFARLEAFEDDQGKPQVAHTRKTVPLFSATIYDLEGLKANLDTSFQWAVGADALARKALFYFEHAQLLHEFAQTLPLHSPHSAFSVNSAFLQLFKALTILLGDPAVDRDHQSRAKRLGLGGSFWMDRVKPLYKIRNENDVAHYSFETPGMTTGRNEFAQASVVFRDALEAYLAARLR